MRPCSFHVYSLGNLGAGPFAHVSALAFRFSVKLAISPPATSVTWDTRSSSRCPKWNRGGSWHMVMRKSRQQSENRPVVDI